MNLILGDCLEKMRELSNNSIDCCLTDPPYGTTACKWDNIIPFKPMWDELDRIVKKNGAICLFGMEPFSSHLRISNLKMFKYDWIWRKNTASGFAIVRYQPMKSHEFIHVFSKERTNYYPQKVKSCVEGRKFNRPNGIRKQTSSVHHANLKVRGENILKEFVNPRTVLEFKTVGNQNGKRFHPTQKPVDLLEYLIKTYTLENQTILDFTMGSGSTGVACKNLNRNFIGIENDEEIFNVAQERLKTK